MYVFMLVHILNCIRLPVHREETKCIEKAVAVLAAMVVVEETRSSLQAPDGLAPEGLHPGTELPLSG